MPGFTSCVSLTPVRWLFGARGAVEQVPQQCPIACKHHEMKDFMADEPDLRVAIDNPIWRFP